MGRDLSKNPCLGGGRVGGENYPVSTCGGGRGSLSKSCGTRHQIEWEGARQVARTRSMPGIARLRDIAWAGQRVQTRLGGCPERENRGII